jgi:hypothetical protein
LLPIDAAIPKEDWTTLSSTWDSPEDSAENRALHRNEVEEYMRRKTREAVHRELTLPGPDEPKFLSKMGLGKFY